MSSTSSPLPTSWAQVLERIDVALADALVKAFESDAALSASAEDLQPDAPEEAGHVGDVRPLGGRLQEWQACVQQVEREALEAEADVDAAENLVAAWRAAMADVERRLADWANRGV
jgi:hypothetical protein